jgi:uncharacterized membrane protein YbhN (UPF0104 family)
VVAGVLLYRALTYFSQIPFGALTYLYWRHSKEARAPRTEEELGRVLG